MQTEKLPTSTPPGPSRPEGPPPEIPTRNSPAEQISWSDRVFWWCFIPAVLVFIGCCLWLNYADIYGTQRTQEQQRRTKVQVYIPPIKHPKPKPKKIIPPKPKPVKIIHTKIPPPPIRRTPPPPAPRAPSVGHVTHTPSPTAIPVGPVTEAPPVAAPQAPGEDTRPAAPIVTPPAPPPPVIEKPAPPAPVVEKPVEQPKPRPVEQPKPKPPDIPDQDVPVVNGSFHDVQLPGDLDVTTLNSTSVTVTWYVDARGHVSDIKFRPTGNSDVDQAIRDSINESHYKPAVHNGQAVREPMEHTFNLG